MSKLFVFGSWSHFLLAIASFILAVTGLGLAFTALKISILFLAFGVSCFLSGAIAVLICPSPMMSALFEISASIRLLAKKGYYGLDPLIGEPTIERELEAEWIEPSEHTYTQPPELESDYRTLKPYLKYFAHPNEMTVDHFIIALRSPERENRFLRIPGTDGGVLTEIPEQACKFYRLDNARLCAWLTYIKTMKHGVPEDVEIVGINPVSEAYELDW